MTNKNKETMKTKQIVMTSAHAIYKMQNVTFSEALTIAWKAIKNGVTVYIRETYLKVKFLSFSKNGWHSDKLENVIDAGKPVHVKYNPAVEKYYGCGMFNND